MEEINKFLDVRSEEELKHFQAHGISDTSIGPGNCGFNMHMGLKDTALALLIGDLYQLLYTVTVSKNSLLHEMTRTNPTKIKEVVGEIVLVFQVKKDKTVVDRWRCSMERLW